MSAEAIERRAALWLVRREQPCWSPEEQTALDAWLDESMAHKAAYWRLEHGWREADRIGALGPATLDEEAPPSRTARWWPLAAAASLVGVLALGAVELARPRPVPVVADQHFVTPVGGRRVVPLIDGSKVELNTATTMRTAVTAEHREVWLDQGEAYFEIAHMEDHPFVVHAGSRTVTVLGTKFSVRREGDRVTVSVVEGRVKVDDARQVDAVPTAILTAGDVAVARGPATLLAAKSEERVASTLAWRGGMLNFDRTSLADAVKEFNRYNRKQITIADAETGNIRIGGTFQAANVDAFVRLLHDAYGLRVESGPDSVKISD
ncbi:FecR domain-containing protein [Sphingomonas sp. AR_OL41]|uniref:FecR family protein n=1 Tax=Sphingomonas sp. AR_OL41 TaxID=3042729 RepID=UPI00248097D5|nr:FecR domain-containing protein [Sphingomonas sp. AR_OL41]MDH7974479.1 FecR domain-containing protein [Sphingomonas sp. AR_OL41]